MNRITNVKVYGINETMIACQYPMATDVSSLEPKESVLKRLGKAKSGSGHDCALKGIIVQADLTCSQAMHMQILRYHFLDVVSSQSKMHRLLKMNLDESCNKYVSEHTISYLKQEIDKYNRMKELSLSEQSLSEQSLSEQALTEQYLKVIYNCPIGLELTFRFTTNYLQLKTIYNQRKNHRLLEWQEFTDWVLTLPQFKILTGLEG